ncbi:MAG: ATPase, T2SS/T4P/T4SS family [Candidatus Coatesbacteria bacterium]
MPPPIKTVDALLVEKGMLTAEQAEAARSDAGSNGGNIAAAIVRLKQLPEDAVGKAIAELRGTRFVDVTTLKQEVMEQLAKLVPGDIAHKYRAIPVGKKFAKFTFAVGDPLEPALINLNADFFRGKAGEIEYWVSGPLMIEDALAKYFPGGPGKKASAAAAAAAAGAAAGSGLDAAMGELGAMKLADGPDGGSPDMNIEVVEEAKDADSDEKVDEAPVVQLVNKIIFEAVERGASDIHLDPQEQGIVLRYRIDGVLHDVSMIPKQWKRALAAVIKVKTKQMKIEERRRPQDAKIKIKVPSRDKPIDLRVSTLPIVWGEKIVMRILDSGHLFTLPELGMEPEELAKLEKAIHMPQGLVLVTGPTGSGKTNTLYSAINAINSRDKNIMTAENPVEFQLVGINQVQIVPEAGMTFPAALKAFLRQDPNIILVGEVRDFEEVDIAVKAAMTGHLVLSTLHTNDAPSTVTRLLDIRDPISGAGTDPGIIASALTIVIAQRLMRRVCKKCKKEYTYPPEEFRRFGLDPKDFEGVQLYKGEGCTVCGKSGYKGRVGIYEVMDMSRGLRDLVMGRADANKLRDQALKEGMSTLRMSAIKKAKAGVSTLEEVNEATIE